MLVDTESALRACLKSIKQPVVCASNASSPHTHMSHLWLVTLRHLCSSDDMGSTRPRFFPRPTDAVTPRSPCVLPRVRRLPGLYGIALGPRKSTPDHDTCHPPPLGAVSCRCRASAGRLSVRLLGLQGRRRSPQLSGIIPGSRRAHAGCVP